MSVWVELFIVGWLLLKTCGVHLCNWSQDNGGGSVCFVFLMAFGSGGFNGWFWGKVVDKEHKKMGFV